LGENINTIRKTQKLYELDTSKAVISDVEAIVFMFCEQTPGQHLFMKVVANKSFENAANFKHLGATIITGTAFTKKSGEIKYGECLLPCSLESYTLAI
jgi:hypothetical protein